MLKWQKKQIQDLLLTMKEANSELFKTENQPNTVALTTGICDFVTAVENFIKSVVDETDKNKKQVLSLFNSYKSKFADLNTLEQKSLKQLIHGIEVTVSKLKITKYEVVFVVDSQAKSDALMPIYEVFNADPDCIARWMPVPLYGLNVARQKSEVKFDGQSSYSGIKCTDFMKYDLKKFRPDIIFTNNIYDNENYVTQLQPEFWSRNLKKYTDCLVYVPYFVSGAYMTETSFIKLSGMIFVDLVILENENVRKFYSDTAKEFFGERFDTRKFVAPGSPKYDQTLKYALLAEENKLDIPQDWKNKIYKSDGTKRKVVFYNTGISTLLRLDNPSVYCEKIENVLALFKKRLEEYDDVVLLWRPHPLIFDTIRSMRPMLAEKWLEIVNKYKSENYGIYDESGDMHKAVAMSDCFYGDWSSVIQLFTILKKNVFVCMYDTYNKQSTEFIIYEIPNLISFFQISNEIYAISANDCIFKFNKETQVFDYLIKIPKTLENIVYYSHFTTKTLDEKTWILPYNSDVMVKFDIKTNSFDFYQLSLKKEFINPFYGNNSNFRQGIFYKNKIFFVPYTYRAIIAYNFDTGETEHILDLQKHFPKDKINMLFCDYEWLNEDTVLMPSLYTNEILEFCLKTYKFKIHKLGNKDRFFHTIQKYGNDYFLVGSQPFVAKWNYETGEFIYYDKLPENFKIFLKTNFTWYMYNIKSYKNKLLLLGGYTNMILEFDFETCEYRQLNNIEKSKKINVKKEHEKFSYSLCNFVSDNIVYFLRYGDAFCSYNIESEEFKEICELKINIPDNVIKEINSEFFNTIVNENVKDDEIKSELCSVKIYDYIKELIKL
ncbi:MAG: hypothetical protein LBL93_05780 [Ruminococcus sp.]|jgi:hypothetical protein|nr:hypothetical protein [Ruminococcus sp.]